MTAHQKLTLGISLAILVVLLAVFVVVQSTLTRYRAKQTTAAKTVIEKYFSATAEEELAQAASNQQLAIDQAIERSVEQWVGNNRDKLKLRAESSLLDQPSIEQFAKTTLEQWGNEVAQDPQVQSLLDDSKAGSDPVGKDYDSLIGEPSTLERLSLTLRPLVGVTADEPGEPEEENHHGGENPEEHKEDHARAEPVARTVLEMFLLTLRVGGSHEEGGHLAQPLPPDHDGELERPLSGSKSLTIDFHEGRLELTHTFNKSLGHIGLRLATKISPDERSVSHVILAHAPFLKRKDKLEMKVFIGGELRHSSSSTFRWRGPAYGIGGVLHL